MQSYLNDAVDLRRWLLTIYSLFAQRSGALPFLDGHSLHRLRSSESIAKALFACVAAFLGHEHSDSFRKRLREFENLHVDIRRVITFWERSRKEWMLSLFMVPLKKQARFKSMALQAFIGDEFMKRLDRMGAAAEKQERERKKREKRAQYRNALLDSDSEDELLECCAADFDDLLPETENISDERKLDRLMNMQSPERDAPRTSAPAAPASARQEAVNADEADSEMEAAAETRRAGAAQES